MAAPPSVVSDGLWSGSSRCCRGSSGGFGIRAGSGCLIGRRCRGSCLCCIRGSRGGICRSSLGSVVGRRVTGGFMSGRGRVWGRLHEVLLSELHASGEIEWSRAVADASHVQAKKMGSATGPPSERP
jgi:hypothetical protein